MRRVAALLGLFLLGGPATVEPTTPTLTVFAAADLAFAFKEIVPLFEKASGCRVTLVLGSTGTLAKQIEHGAPADVFFASRLPERSDMIEVREPVLPAQPIPGARSREGGNLPRPIS